MRNELGQFVKGFKHSEKSIEKIKKNHKGMEGKKHSDTTKKKISLSKMGFVPWNKGIKMWENKEHPKGMKGKVAWNRGLKGIYTTSKKGKKFPQFSSENHWNWKGDKVGNKAIHDWVVSHKGKAIEYQCKHCNKQAKHWANKDHLYKRNLDDFMALCVSCHRKYDYKYNCK